MNCINSIVTNCVPNKFWLQIKWMYVMYVIIFSTSFKLMITPMPRPYSQNNRIFENTKRRDWTALIPIVITKGFELLFLLEDLYFCKGVVIYTYRKTLLWQSPWHLVFICVFFLHRTVKICHQTSRGLFTWAELAQLAGLIRVTNNFSRPQKKIWIN